MVQLWREIGPPGARTLRGGETVNMIALKARADAMENQYVREHEHKFRVDARRTTLMATWAGQLIGREDIDAYVDEILTEDILKPGGALARLRRDFAAAGVSVTDDEMQSRLAAVLRQTAIDMAS